MGRNRVSRSWIRAADSAGRQLVDAANLGQPLLLLDPATQEPITRDLDQLVAHIAGERDPHPHRLVTPPPMPPRPRSRVPPPE